MSHHERMLDIANRVHDLEKKLIRIENDLSGFIAAGGSDCDAEFMSKCFLAGGLLASQYTQNRKIDQEIAQDLKKQVDNIAEALQSEVVEKR